MSIAAASIPWDEPMDRCDASVSDASLDVFLRVVSLVNRARARVLDEVLTPNDVDIAEWRMLTHVSRQTAARAHSLAEESGLTRTRTDSLIASLHAKGLVEPVEIGVEGSWSAIAVTPQGRDLMRSLEPRRIEAEARELNRLSLAELDDLKRALLRFDV